MTATRRYFVHLKNYHHPDTIDAYAEARQQHGSNLVSVRAPERREGRDAAVIVSHAIEVVHWTVLESVFMDQHRDEQCGESLQALFNALVAQGFISATGERLP